MIIRILFCTFLFLPIFAVAEEPINPLHFLTADWGLEALDNSVTSEHAGLNYGFQQADLSADPPATDYVLATNNCSVSTVLRSLASLSISMGTIGNCEEETELPLFSDVNLELVIPGRVLLPYGPLFPFVVQDRTVQVGTAALAAETYAVSTSIGTYGTAAASLGFERLGFFQSFVAEKSENAQFSDLDGDWAFTRLEVEVSPGNNTVNYTVLTFPAAITVEDGGGLFAPAEDTEFIESEFFQNLDGSGVEKRRFESTFEEEDIFIPMDLSDDGELSMTFGDTGQPGRNPQILAGFIAPTADFLVFAEGVPGIYPLREGDLSLPDVNQFSAHQLFVGIKRNNSPKLNGRKYQLVGLKFHPHAEGFELATWTEEARLHFQGKEGGTWRIETKGKRVKLGNADIAGVTSFTETERVRFKYLVEDDGRIFIDVGEIENLEQGLVNGYASTDNRILVFSHALSLNEAENGEIGMWIGLCSNCEEDEED